MRNIEAKAEQAVHAHVGAVSAQAAAEISAVRAQAKAHGMALEAAVRATKFTPRQQ